MGPFIKSSDTTFKIKLRLLLSLIPLLIYYVYINNYNSLINILIGISLSLLFSFINIYAFNNKCYKTDYMLVSLILLLILPCNITVYITSLIITLVLKLIFDEYSININPILISFISSYVMFNKYFINADITLKLFVVNLIMYFIIFIYLLITKTIKFNITIFYILFTIMLSYVMKISVLYNVSLLFYSLYLITDSNTPVTPLGSIYYSLFLSIITIFLIKFNISPIIGILFVSLFNGIFDNIGSISRFNYLKSLGLFIFAWILIIIMYIIIHIL